MLADDGIARGQAKSGSALLRGEVRVEDAVEDAADAAEEAIEAGDLEAAVEAVKESVEESVEDVKAELDVALDDLEDLTVAGLKERLVELGLPTKGRKADLIARITEYVEGSQ